MCCILSCCVWALDLIQRMLTLLLACILMTLVVIVLVVAIVTGIAYGYNYSIAEFLTFKKADVTVYMRRGQFSDEADLGLGDKDRPPFIVQRRGGGGAPEDLFPAGEVVDLKKVTPDAGGDARQLADLWEQTKDARKYDSILNKFTPRRKEKVTKETTRSYINDMIESIFIEQDYESQDNFQDKTTKFKAKPTKTTKQSPPTERRVKEMFRKVPSYNKKVKDYVKNKPTKAKKITVRTTNTLQSTGRRVMDNFKPIYVDEENQDEYDFHNETVKSETVTAKITKEPDVKIRIDDSINYDQYDLHKETVKSKTVTTKSTKNPMDPDVKIRIDDIRINDDEEEKNKIVEQALGENEGYSESEEEDRIVHDIQEEVKRNNADKPKQNDKRNEPGMKVQVENFDADTTSEKTNFTENTRYRNTDNRYNTRIPDINKSKVRVESEDDESDKDIKKAVVEKNTENTRYRIINTEKRYKTRIPDIKVRVESEDDESDQDIKKSVVEPLENVEYEEQFDSRSSDQRHRNINRLKFDAGATRHPYKAPQPPHLYREEDDDVMYKPV